MSESQGGLPLDRRQAYERMLVREDWQRALQACYIKDGLLTVDVDHPDKEALYREIASGLRRDILLAKVPTRKVVLLKEDKLARNDPYEKPEAIVKSVSKIENNSTYSGLLSMAGEFRCTNITMFDMIKGLQKCSFGYAGHKEAMRNYIRTQFSNAEEMIEKYDPSIIRIDIPNVNNEDFLFATNSWNFVVKEDDTFYNNEWDTEIIRENEGMRTISPRPYDSIAYPTKTQQRGVSKIKVRHPYHRLWALENDVVFGGITDFSNDPDSGGKSILKRVPDPSGFHASFMAVTFRSTGQITNDELVRLFNLGYTDEGDDRWFGALPVEQRFSIEDSVVVSSYDENGVKLIYKREVDEKVLNQLLMIYGGAYEDVGEYIDFETPYINENAPRYYPYKGVKRTWNSLMSERDLAKNMLKL